MKHQISLTVNGQIEELLVEPNQTLLSVLRDDLRLTGAKHGCGAGECGSCTVLLDGQPVNSCLVLAVSASGGSITTIEGLAEGGRLSPIQDAFVEKGAIQCGFCTPGMILTATVLLKENPNPNRQEIRAAISGNLCRCTGYHKIVDAVRAAAEGQGEGGER